MKKIKKIKKITAKTIKGSCGNEGCSIKVYVLPYGIKKVA